MVLQTSYLIRHFYLAGLSKTHHFLGIPSVSFRRVFPSGNSQLVRMLLQRNADFKAADNNGATALHYVAQSNFSETVKVFLSCDRLEDVPDNEGRTALMWASGKGKYRAQEQGEKY